MNSIIYSEGGSSRGSSESEEFDNESEKEAYFESEAAKTSLLLRYNPIIT